MAKAGKFTYRCWFRLDGSKYCTDCDKGVGIFKDGFWIDDVELEITFGGDGVYWIPPAAILHIEKVYDDA